MTQSTAPSTGARSASALSAEEVAAIRAGFPYLERPARNSGALAYLDWAATSQKPASVITTEADFYRISNGAAGRSTYQLADEATATFEDARDAVAAFVGARGSELVFTKNATEAINLVALAIGHASLGRPASRGGGAAAADDPARRLIIGEATRSSSPVPSTMPTSCPGRSCAPAQAPPCAGWT
ncbi:aminotransferase, class V domain protein [Actinomyces naeslundii str. Howell 279]|uniref:Aminotransferase, class V domain protein n=1 Tax=Actinomyces naeslundii (strain ATCC 12104 / DSM 43013 / CCUG 2238 / JCM 8349 / NCTC 10301 / Howell 279) TaxID=1115803 RepID=J3F4V0_ACTNH|nr:aminotransferase, class V domain protein [Actinomyces naeslundii str. Howell 279]